MPLNYNILISSDGKNCGPSRLKSKLLNLFLYSINSELKFAKPCTNYVFNIRQPLMRINEKVV